MSRYKSFLFVPVVAEIIILLRMILATYGYGNTSSGSFITIPVPLPILYLVSFLVLTFLAWVWFTICVSIYALLKALKQEERQIFWFVQFFSILLLIAIVVNY